MFYNLAQPYILYCNKIIPIVKLRRASVEISSIVGLEVLNVLIYYCVRIVNLILLVIKGLEENAKNSENTITTENIVALINSIHLDSHLSLN